MNVQKSIQAKGQYMAAELQESTKVFCLAAAQDVQGIKRLLQDEQIRAIYTVARGSSDAAANILSYEFMRELGIPVTSLPPSVYSVGKGVAINGALGMVISQSGASDDLIRATHGMKQGGGLVTAITNVSQSEVEKAADVTLSIKAGEEKAVPATKTVIGSVGAGLALLAALKPAYQSQLLATLEGFAKIGSLPETEHSALKAALLRARNVYIVGRDTGFGAAHEIALKIKETCAIHAEAYSASEVLHGPLQLATNALTVFVLDTGSPGTLNSLEKAVERFKQTGAEVHRVSADDGFLPAAAAAAILRLFYPVILDVALELGLDPDAPATLSKVTVTT